MKIVRFVTELPETEAVLARREFKNKLMSHPNVWAELEYKGMDGVLFSKKINLNKDPDFPAKSFETRNIDGTFYIRYVLHEGSFSTAPRDVGPDGEINHGHVWPRMSGLKARCGGRAMCKVCIEHERLAQLGY